MQSQVRLILTVGFFFSVRNVVGIFPSNLNCGAAAANPSVGIACPTTSSPCPSASCIGCTSPISVLVKWNVLGPPQSSAACISSIYLNSLSASMVAFITTPDTYTNIDPNTNTYYLNYIATIGTNNCIYQGNTTYTMQWCSISGGATLPADFATKLISASATTGPSLVLTQDAKNDPESPCCATV